MDHQIGAPVRRVWIALFAAIVCVGVATSSSDAGNIQGSTAAFAITGGYSAVELQNGTTLSQRTHHYSGTGPIDVFYNVASSGGTVAHTYLLTVANYSGVPIIGYQFELGTTSQNYYQNINIDGDAFADNVDTDDDADGIADVNDNAPWVANASQVDTDNDSWGDVADIQPNIALIPLAYGGAPIANPRLPVPTTIATFNPNGSLVFSGSPSSTVFSTPSQAGGTLSWTGGALAPDAAATFTFTVEVPDGLAFDGFVLRQTAVVPEPATCGALLAGLSAIPFARQRRGRRG